jgi:hypothetical protein
MIKNTWVSIVTVSLLLGGCTSKIDIRASDAKEEVPQWLAGDHHVHSEYSVKWRHENEQDKSVPPIPLLGGDAIYSILENVEMGKQWGLKWMVTTDHGGPHHSKLNHEKAYPDVLGARKSVPEMVLFYGMELDTPGAEHSTLIIPHTHDEAEQLLDIESKYNKREPFPPNADWDTEDRMNDALHHMKTMHTLPVVIANHPSRTMEQGQYTKLEPSELRRWNDIAPNIAIGMEGAPGHQARARHLDGSFEKFSARGGYRGVATRGGFDPMTSVLGGFWDSMLGEGRRWWITATSDAHRNWRDGGVDFWPGEYSKTYVLAKPEYASILKALRAGHIFVTTGDLISQLTFVANAENMPNQVSIGQQLEIEPRQNIVLDLGFCESKTVNANGDQPTVKRMDVIVGDINSENYSPQSDSNYSTRVLRRIKRLEFKESNDNCFSHQIEINGFDKDFYIRLRGTNTDEMEPTIDPRGEDPWEDLWFYSNPIFVSMAKR